MRYTGLDDSDSGHATQSREQGARTALDAGQGEERRMDNRPDFMPTS
jgi:hypothetical protein